MLRITRHSKVSSARRGVLTLPHGKVRTPFFMPIATRGAVRSVPFSDVKKLGAEIALANTYHLLLRPGHEVLKKIGGLHKFTGWDRPILTDSGGYQVFSLSKFRKICDQGVEFRSHLDGGKVLLTPETSLRFQVDLGVDIAMVLDDVVAHPATKSQAKEAVRRTTEWARRSHDFMKKKDAKRTNVFGIIQGSTYEDLRVESAKQLTEIDFDGFAIGGLSVGEPAKDMYAMTDIVVPHLPKDRPRYLMGVGTPDNIVESVKRGVDMFDCVIPTRNARHGMLYVNRGWSLNKGSITYDTLRIKNQRYAKKDEAIDASCSCQTCKTTSRAYLRHLFHVGEPLAMHLASVHNLAFYLGIMKDLQDLIQKGKI